MNSSLELALSFIGLLALIALLLSTDVYAEPGPLGFGYAELHESMSTDRPGFTDTTQTVQKGHLQIETGYQFTYDDDTDLREHLFGGTSLRFGILDLAEFRLGVNAYQETSLNDQNSYGVGDLTVGTKVKVFEACDCNFEISTIFDLTLPTGSEDLSQDDVSSRAVLLWAYNWETDFSLGGNLNFNVPVEDGDYYFEPSASFTVGYSITENWGSYFEYFGVVPSGGNAPSTTASNFLNGGFTYMLSENLQLDLSSGFGINDSAEDFFSSCGISFRI